MTKWENDLGKPIAEKDLKLIWYTTAHCSINTATVESNYKLLMRWYLVPQRLAKLNPAPAVSDKCFRDCLSTGTLLHKWWDCPKIKQFWTDIYQIIFTLFGKQLPKNQQEALLNLKPKNFTNNSFHPLAFLFIADKTLAKAWWSSTPHQLKIK